jgi:hypothetical protein
MCFYCCITPSGSLLSTMIYDEAMLNSIYELNASLIYKKDIFTNAPLPHLRNVARFIFDTIKLDENPFTGDVL